ncbi:hypothetical protein Poli38472_003886 [Pythium oligandrum]|uniref:PX domain-containing protein n=1 Tax=Pythium oligandrum TaxID=41045 RepID=A0A8K1FKJ5_PYTOL|nr:hypothetical protein Poli38472_003886 [Pythium oligandrum]|eukprot:TMW66121.1 hypothetical protein Poli38472_003886 [Pythium oligandrum]
MPARELVEALHHGRCSIGNPAKTVMQQLLSSYRRSSLPTGTRKKEELTGKRSASLKPEYRPSNASTESTSSPKPTPSAEDDFYSEFSDMENDGGMILNSPSTVSIPYSTPRRQYGTVLMLETNQELFLFREEAEYSDYFQAMLTDKHREMDSVVFYELEIRLSQNTWKVLRRFSEFRRLRQRLIKHFTHRQRLQCRRKCPICAHILQSIQDEEFPSRVQKKTWFSRSNPASSSDFIADRKQKLQAFVTTCILTVRGLRQHSRLMCDSSQCELDVALRMIEEFLGLSFTRYMRFLNERGIISDDEEETSKCAPQSQRPKGKALANVSSKTIGGKSYSLATQNKRRATIAV